MWLAASADPLVEPTSLTAIFTGVLAGGAILTAIFAALAFWKQSTEVGILQKQVQRDVLERRRAQASRVFVWERRIQAIRNEGPRPGVTGGVITAYLRNASDQPVYDVEFRWLLHDRQLPHPYATNQTEAPLGPGDQLQFEFEGNPEAPLRVFSVVVCFRDAAGVRWLRRPNGYLEELARS